MNIENNIKRAKQLLEDADAILITAGAGIGVDSGLPDFRGNEGFWEEYPPLFRLGYEFSDMAGSLLFTKKPNLAWGFYGHRLNLYRSINPHMGFKLLFDLVKRKKDNYFIFTSNVDGQFQKAGFDEDKIYEIHGSIHYLQCTKKCTKEIWKNNLQDIEIDLEKLESQVLPRCKNCKALARPNILMLRDGYFIGNRSDAQNKIFRDWRLANKDSKILIVEIGAGSAIPTIRNFGDNFSTSNNINLIRINPREYAIHDEKNISIALGGLDGIMQIL